jgi:hypothetical protein
LNEQTGEVYEPAQYIQNEDTIMLKKAWNKPLERL